MLYGCYIHYEDHAQYELCDFGVCSREILCMFLVSQVPGLVLHLDFFRHRKCSKCQTLPDSVNLFITCSVTLTLFQGHSNEKQL